LRPARRRDSRGRWSRALKTCESVRDGLRASRASPGLRRRYENCWESPDALLLLLAARVLYFWSCNFLGKLRSCLQVLLLGLAIRMHSCLIICRKCCLPCSLIAVASHLVLVFSQNILGQTDCTKNMRRN
jgi:hypothetical protein